MKTAENPPAKRYRYGVHDDFEARSQRRLQNDLGLDTAGSEAILHLRRQVVELQARIRQMEIELDSQYASQSLRLAHLREVYYEAVWIEFDIQE